MVKKEGNEIGTALVGRRNSAYPSEHGRNQEEAIGTDLRNAENVELSSLRLASKRDSNLG